MRAPAGCAQPPRRTRPDAAHYRCRRADRRVRLRLNPGGRREVVTTSSGAHGIRDLHRDGRPSAVAQHRASYRYEYGRQLLGHDGVALLATWQKQIRVEPDATLSAAIDTAEWQTTYRDALGRVIRERGPAPDGSGAVGSDYFYAADGRLARSRDADGIPRCMPTPRWASASRTAIDASRNGRIDLDGSDRVTETRSTYQLAEDPLLSGAVAQTTVAVYTATGLETTRTDLQVCNPASHSRARSTASPIRGPTWAPPARRKHTPPAKTAGSPTQATTGATG